MAHKFYSDPVYRSRQSFLTKARWRNGSFMSLIKKEKRICAREECGNFFELIPSDPKKYCGSRCSAIVNNKKRGAHPTLVRQKISKTLFGRISPQRGIIKVPRVELSCLKCQKIFLQPRWMRRKFCSNQCAISVTGGQPTSPRASRGKAGIRKDISVSIYFYSRWEANIARLFNLLNIEWQHQPRIFDLGNQKYTPDFYLPEQNTYLEIKNFWWSYSIERDRKFRKIYPDIRLDVILKNDYQIIEKEYAELIPNWEYKNSKFLKGD